MSPIGKIGMLVAVCFLLCGCEAEKQPVQSASPSPPVSLTGTQWTLEEIGGKPVIPDSKATLSFPEAGKAAGNGSCNRIMGSVELSGETIKFGALAEQR